MKRDFTAELKAICNQDKQIEKTIERTEAPIYYNVHKRSLPVGIDKIVLMGLTKEQADDAIKTVFKPKKVYERIENSFTGEVETKESIIRYEAFKEDATLLELNVFHNDYEKPVFTWGD